MKSILWYLGTCLSFLFLLTVGACGPPGGAPGLQNQDDSVINPLDEEEPEQNSFSSQKKHFLKFLTKLAEGIYDEVDANCNTNNLEQVLDPLRALVRHIISDYASVALFWEIMAGIPDLIGDLGDNGDSDSGDSDNGESQDANGQDEIAEAAVPILIDFATAILSKDPVDPLCDDTGAVRTDTFWTPSGIIGWLEQNVVGDDLIESSTADTVVYKLDPNRICGTGFWPQYWSDNFDPLEEGCKQVVTDGQLRVKLETVGDTNLHFALLAFDSRKLVFEVEFTGFEKALLSFNIANVPPIIEGSGHSVEEVLGMGSHLSGIIGLLGEFGSGGSEVREDLLITGFVNEEVQLKFAASQPGQGGDESAHIVVKKAPTFVSMYFDRTSGLDLELDVKGFNVNVDTSQMEIGTINVDNTAIHGKLRGYSMLELTDVTLGGKPIVLRNNDMEICTWDMNPDDSQPAGLQVSRQGTTFYGTGLDLADIQMRCQEPAGNGLPSLVHLILRDDYNFYFDSKKRMKDNTILLGLILKEIQKAGTATP